MHSNLGSGCFRFATDHRHLSVETVWVMQRIQVPIALSKATDLYEALNVNGIYWGKQVNYRFPLLAGQRLTMKWGALTLMY